MAKVIVKITTVYAQKGMKDKDLEKAIESAISKVRREIADTKSGGAFQNANIHFIQSGRKRYKIFLTFLRFN